jgi:hypothetical protein
MPSNKLKECECYNLKDRRWELLPGLNSARLNPALCIYNGQYLYAFQGWNRADVYLDTIEFINISNIMSGWTIFKPQDPGCCWSPCYNSSAVVIGKDKILICGGYVNGMKYTNNTFIYDITKKTVYRGKDLVKGAIFNSIGTFVENNAVVIDCKNESSKPFGVHIYDKENNIWKFNQN